MVVANKAELIAKQLLGADLNKKTWGGVMYNVLVEGLTGNGVTDDTAKLQALVDKAISEGRKAIFFPHGTYYVTSLSNADQVVFFGDNSSFVGGYVGIINQIGDWVGDSIAVKKGELAYNPKDYGAKGDGITDDTESIRNALDACKNAGGGIILFPFGTYMVNNLAYVLSSTMIVQGSGKDITILKNVNNAAGVRFFSLATGSQIKDLTLDGNKATQTVSTHAILGYNVSKCYLQNVKVINHYGIGIGLSNCWDCVLNGCEVWYSGKNNCGFWHGWDINTSPQNSGGHLFENCISKYNDLDGMILNTPNCKIIGGEYSFNGQNPTGGALGAGGIYSDTLQEGITIIGVTCKGNTEFGINGMLKNAIIDGCRCTENALAGIYVRNTSQRVKIMNTECSRNGNNPTTSNPTIWGKAGIQYNGVSFLVIVGCSCYDDRGVPTQVYGIQGMGVNASNGVIATSNNLKYNKSDDSNIAAGYTVAQHNTTNIVYVNNY